MSHLIVTEHEIKVDFSSKEEVHQDLISLVYNLPFGIMCEHLYSFIVFALDKWCENAISLLSRKIRTKAENHIKHNEKKEHTEKGSVV